MDILLPEMPLTDELEDDNLDELMPDIYVERISKILFEVKFFDGFCLVRPATPMFYSAIKKLSHTDFVRDFDEFFGDINSVRDALRGMTPEFIVEPN